MADFCIYVHSLSKFNDDSRSWTKNGGIRFWMMHIHNNLGGRRLIRGKGGLYTMF